jgi:hypothetical protein
MLSKEVDYELKYISSNKLPINLSLDEFQYHIARIVSKKVADESNLSEDEYVMVRNQMQHYVKNFFYDELKDFWNEQKKDERDNQSTKGEYNEVEIKQKTPIGFGNFHNVYDSKYKPDVVYKIGDESVVRDWYELFKEHPDLFPKVYKKGVVNIPVKNQNGDVVKKVKKSYVEVEKLDTNRLKKEWNLIDRFSNGNFQYNITRIEEKDDFFQQLGDEITKVNTPLYEAFARIYNLVFSVYEVKPSADIHMGQFGYDKQGNLKCLDL